jgi:hypothetical protein
METIVELKAPSPQAFMATIDIAQTIRPVAITVTNNKSRDWPLRLVEQIILEIVNSRFPKEESEEYCTYLFSQPQGLSVSPKHQSIIVK